MGEKDDRFGSEVVAHLGQSSPYSKRAPTVADALSIRTENDRYIFFSEHTFFAASHVPPAFSQSAAFFAVVTSPANAGIANPSASAKASVERNGFMLIPPTHVSRGAEETLLEGDGSVTREDFVRFRTVFSSAH
jgi:hypothetical protein